uniref:Uncharacterized protein n=1 Tax=Romanomermis culicivorax TaxID=13658 RepID=A0A915J630_ROMCU
MRVGGWRGCEWKRPPLPPGDEPALPPPLLEAADKQDVEPAVEALMFKVLLAFRISKTRVFLYKTHLHMYKRQPIFHLCNLYIRNSKIQRMAFESKNFRKHVILLKLAVKKNKA